MKAQTRDAGDVRERVIVNEVADHRRKQRHIDQAAPPGRAHMREGESASLPQQDGSQQRRTADVSKSVDRHRAMTLCCPLSIHREQ